MRKKYRRPCHGHCLPLMLLLLLLLAWPVGWPAKVAKSQQSGFPLRVLFTAPTRPKMSSTQTASRKTSQPAGLWRCFGRM